VTLTGPAPEGGALVLLTADSAHVLLPETVVVPEGAVSAAFTIATTPVDAVTDVTIEGTWRATHAARLTLLPPRLN